jgi:hypothetical protein
VVKGSIHYQETILLLNVYTSNSFKTYKTKITQLLTKPTNTPPITVRKFNRPCLISRHVKLVKVKKIRQALKTILT